MLYQCKFDFLPRIGTTLRSKIRLLFSFSILCRAARVVEEPAEETTTPVNKYNFREISSISQSETEPETVLAQNPS